MTCHEQISPELVERMIQFVRRLQRSTAVDGLLVGEAFRKEDAPTQSC